MPTLGERGKAHLDQIRGTTPSRAIDPTHDTTASRSNLWKKKPPPIETPSNTGFANPYSKPNTHNLRENSNPIGNSTLTAGIKRKRNSIDPDIYQFRVLTRPNKKRLLTKSGLNAISPPKTISDKEDDMNTSDPLENNLLQMPLIQDTTVSSRPSSEHRPAHVVDKSKLKRSPSLSSSIESFGAEQRPWYVWEWVRQKMENFDYDPHGSKLDMRKLTRKDAKGIKSGHGRRVFPTFQEAQELIATLTTPYEAKGKAKQTQLDIRIPIAEWFMGSMHFSEPCTVVVVGQSLQIRTSTTSFKIPFSEIYSATIGKPSDPHQCSPCLKIIPKPSFRKVWKNKYYQPGERPGMITLKAHPADGSWKDQSWEDLGLVLQTLLDSRCTVSHGFSSVPMWEAALHHKVAIRRRILEDEGEVSIAVSSNTKAIPSITNVTEDRSPSTQTSIPNFLDSSKELRPKAQATHESSHSRLLPTVFDDAEGGVPPQNIPRRFARQAKPKQKPAVDLDKV